MDKENDDLILEINVVSFVHYILGLKLGIEWTDCIEGGFHSITQQSH